MTSSLIFGAQRVNFFYATNTKLILGVTDCFTICINDDLSKRKLSMAIELLKQFLAPSVQCEAFWALKCKNVIFLGSFEQMIRNSRITEFYSLAMNIWGPTWDSSEITSEDFRETISLAIARPAPRLNLAPNVQVKICDWNAKTRFSLRHFEKMIRRKRELCFNKRAFTSAPIQLHRFRLINGFKMPKRNFRWGVFGSIVQNDTKIANQISIKSRRILQCLRLALLTPNVQVRA